MQFTFHHTPLELVRRQYANGRVCLQAYTLDGEPYLTATVNVPDVDLEDGQVVIKDYSENAGVLKALVDAGIVDLPDGIVSLGYVCGWVCRLL